MKAAHQTLLAVALSAACAMSNAHAGVQIAGTRIVYPAKDHSVTVNVLNDGKSPRLLQVWADEGNSADTAATTKAPFVITPPVSRVDPGHAQALRLMFTGAQVPQDRETVYWLNVLEVPPRPKASESSESSEAQNFMQLAVRTRIKIFYRPKGLQGDPLATLDKLQWRALKRDGQYVLECNNPTGYNASFNQVGVKGQALEGSMSGSGGMCPAMGRQTFAVDGAHVSASGGTVVFSAINDWGGFVEKEAPYTP